MICTVRAHLFFRTIVLYGVVRNESTAAGRAPGGNRDMDRVVTLLLLRHNFGQGSDPGLPRTN